MSSWLEQLLQVFVGVPHLIAPLVVRLWDLLSNRVGDAMHNRRWSQRVL